VPEDVTVQALRPRRVLPLIAVAAFLALYGNAVSTVMAFPTPLGEGTGLAVSVLLVVVVLAWARGAGMTWTELGFGPGNPVRSALIGLLAAVIIVTPALLFIRFPPIFGTPVTYGPAALLTDSALAQRVLVLMPLDTAIPEEIAFRGVLLGALLRRHTAVSAVLLAAVPFTLWHLVIVGRTLGLTNLAEQPPYALLGFLGALVAVFVGALIFGWLRIATGHLAASMTAHWGFNASLLVGLRVLQG
jgi:membrane protease YdiL (CAAX protease family)